MPGTYAPPAVELPNTTETVGSFIAEDRVRSRKPRPPGMKISLCVGRSAPPDSVRFTVGRLFWAAMSAARKFFFTDQGLRAPPFTVGSLATIMHSTPSHPPLPVPLLAPTPNSLPPPARGPTQ